MKFEAICGVAVRDLGLEVGRQIDDMDRAERTFFRTDTTSNTETLGDKRNLRFGSDLDAELASADNWTGLLTLLTTFLSGVISKRSMVYLVRSRLPLACTIDRRKNQSAG